MNVPPEATTASEPTSLPTEAPEKVLTIAIPQQYSKSFDIFTQVAAMEPTSMIYEGLVNMDTNYKIQPGLAESWDVSSDGLIVTFHLKQGVTFTDGSPF